MDNFINDINQTSCPICRGDVEDGKCTTCGFNLKFINCLKNIQKNNTQSNSTQTEQNKLNMKTNSNVNCNDKQSKFSTKQNKFKNIFVLCIYILFFIFSLGNFVSIGNNFKYSSNPTTIDFLKIPFESKLTAGELVSEVKNLQQETQSHFKKDDVTEEVVSKYYSHLNNKHNMFLKALRLVDGEQNNLSYLFFGFAFSAVIIITTGILLIKSIKRVFYGDKNYIKPIFVIMPMILNVLSLIFFYYKGNTHMGYSAIAFIVLNCLMFGIYAVERAYKSKVYLNKMILTGVAFVMCICLTYPIFRLNIPTNIQDFNMAVQISAPSGNNDTSDKSNKTVRFYGDDLNVSRLFNLYTEDAVNELLYKAILHKDNYKNQNIEVKDIKSVFYYGGTSREAKENYIKAYDYKYLHVIPAVILQFVIMVLNFISIIFCFGLLRRSIKRIDVEDNGSVKSVLIASIMLVAFTGLSCIAVNVLLGIKFSIRFNLILVTALGIATFVISKAKSQKLWYTIGK